MLIFSTVYRKKKLSRHINMLNYTTATVFIEELLLLDVDISNGIYAYLVSNKITYTPRTVGLFVIFMNIAYKGHTSLSYITNNSPKYISIEN